jgi:hypothetical protein
LNIYQIEKYAQDNGFNSVEFYVLNPLGKKMRGSFVDAYMGMITIP